MLGQLSRHKAKLTAAGLVVLAVGALGLFVAPPWLTITAWVAIGLGSVSYLMAR